MDIFLVIIRAFLAAVFIVAAVSKLRDQAGTRKAAVSFGVPESMSVVFALVLPMIEIVAAALLLFATLSWFGSLAITVLLVVFTIAISIQLFKGAEPDCHCFGQLGSEKIGISSVFRNALFIAPAIFLVSRGQVGQGQEFWELDRTSVPILLGSAAVILLVVAIQLMQSVLTKQAELAQRIELLELAAPVAEVEREHAGHPHDGLPIGAMLPEFELKDTDGEVVSTSSLYGDGKGALLLFVSPTCSPCKALVPKVRDWATDLSAKVNVYLITSGTADENIRKFGDVPSSPLLLQEKREFADALNAKWTPSAMYINSQGRVSSHVSAGDNAVAELIEQLRSTDLDGFTAIFEVPNANGGFNRVKIGADVPEFELETIDGEKLANSGLKGKRTLVAFWSTNCPHCNAMASDLRSWANKINGSGPSLVMLSTGEIDDHRGLDINVPIAIDEGNKVGEMLGMYGTPSAVLIDENGQFDSEIAVGASNIWTLVGGKP